MPPQKKRTLRVIITELVERANVNTRRLRDLEQKSNVLISRVDAIEQTILSHKKGIDRILSDINLRITKSNEAVIRMQNTIKDIITQLKKAVTQAKIRELEKLIEMYNPIKSQFVTKEEVERLLEESKTSSA